MNKEVLLKKLVDLQDLKYKSFQEKLIPTIDPNTIIGVRTPELKKIAKEVYLSDYKDSFLGCLPHQYFEENQIHSFIIALEKDYDKCIKLINDFLPYIDNWATCDQATPAALKKRPDDTLKEIKKWFKEDKTYYYRYGIEQLMSFYLNDRFKKEYLEMVAGINSEEYYVKMMQGWFFATALAKQYDDTILYIEKGLLEKDVNNITIKKAIESYRINDSKKEYLRKFRIR